MRLFILTLTYLVPLVANAADIVVLGFKDGFEIGSSNREVTIYLDGEKVAGNQKLPFTVQTNSKRTDITICDGNLNFCDSATIYPDNSKPVQVGFFVQSLAGNLYFKTLTGGGLKVIQAKVLEQELKSVEIEQAKTYQVRP